MKRLRVQLCQVNNIFANQAFLPYSAGMIQAYSEAQPSLRQHVEFDQLLYRRDSIQDVVGRIVDPDVLGLSCYVWNWEYSLTLAAATKQLYPECLVVLGGPHVPLRSESFFLTHPYVDLLVHHEGEIAFAEILGQRLTTHPDYRSITGLSVRLPDNSCMRTKPRPRNNDLELLPSPYLSGIFNELIDLPYHWNATHETNRGCPYSCSFCDWGSAVFTKLRQFSTPRLELELQWFGDNQIEILYNADANLGILERDLHLTQVLTDVKRRTGYPHLFRPSFAKKSNENVFKIAKELQAVGLQRGVTLSMQSMSDTSLSAIRRRNIKIDDLVDRLTIYRTHSMPTYTELILGLPGETYTSFTTGVEELLKAGQHEGLLVYLCEVLPNSELAEPHYQELHGIRSVRMPIVLGYATPNDDEVTEYFDVVIETATLCHAEWRQALLYSWAIQAFHCLNITRLISLYLWTEHGVGYRAFYEGLLDFSAQHSGSLLGAAYHHVSRKIDEAVAGAELGEIVPEFGAVTWHPEEASFLSLVGHKSQVMKEIASFLSQFLSELGIAVADSLHADLVRYQAAALVGPGEPRAVSLTTSCNLHEYLHEALRNNKIELVAEQSTVNLVAAFRPDTDLPDYAMTGVRYGRKNNHLCRSAVE